MTDFEVTLECSNCGSDWTLEFATKWRIRDEGNGTVEVRCPVAEEVFGHATDCDDCRRLECPTCELHDTVSVIDRNPIEE